MNIPKLSLNKSGYIKNRESQSLEFKQAFQKGDSLLTYIRTLVGMANNQGGFIIFGIQDQPHIPVGLQNTKFQSCDPKDINQRLLEYFSTDIEWSSDAIEMFGVKLGILHVEEAKQKPIVCTKGNQKSKLREAAVYYRYRGETKEIRYAELKDILDEERGKEKKLWMSHIESIATIGPRAVQIIDTVQGEMDIGGKKILIDSDLISKLKVIKEGQFSEKEGAPTLRVVGEIDGLANADTIYTESAYPYTQANFTKILPLNRYDFQALSWKLGLKGDPRYHLEVATGAKSSTQKYSDKALSLLREKLREDPKLLETVKSGYKAHMKRKKNG